MNRPPEFYTLPVPHTPNWRRWWLALLLLWSVQSALALWLWPEDRPRIQLWLLGALLPLSWGLVLGIRMLPWTLRLKEIAIHERVQDQAVRQWWALRGWSLPVQQVLLVGPAGTAQGHYAELMRLAPTPQPWMSAGSAHGHLRCPLSLVQTDQRTALLAVHLVQLLEQVNGVGERWPHLRGLCWSGDPLSEAVFRQSLADKGLVVPEARMPLQTLADLDGVIDEFNTHCDRPDDWLLCAGVVSVDQPQEQGMPGEAGFVWIVSHDGKGGLHRSETAIAASGDEPAALCAQIQRYAGLTAPPAACLAMGPVSDTAFAAAGWSTDEHQLMDKWGALGPLTPFIAMSLALLQVGHSGQGCGWLSQDAENGSAIGVAMPYDYEQ